MSGHHRHHGRLNPVGGVPAAPPPPVLSSSGRQGRNAVRHSRSRSPRNFNRSRSNNTRFSRQDPPPREERGRRGRSRSQSPFAGAAVNTSADLYRSSKGSMMSHGLLNHHDPLPLGKSQSISLITGEGSLPIIRRILDPDSVKIPRRNGEGGRPIFDREELQEGLRRRFAADDDDGRGGRIPSPAIPQPSQRVIAIIREPTLGSRTESFRRPSSSTNKGLDHSGAGYALSSRDSQPAHHRDFRDRQRSMSPPTRERDVRERPRERPSLAQAPSSVQLQRSGGDRDRVRGGGEDSRIRSRSTDRDRVNRERIQPQNARPNRSPVRILRDRPSRSHSRTPPPMPAEIRRQMIERQRDLRSKLSRPAGRFAGGKFDTNSVDFRGGGDSSFRGRGGGFARGRGGGGFRGRDDGRSGRGPWEHDLFERDGVDGELKSK